MIKLIVFDLDGVLIDSVNIHINSFNESVKIIAGEEFIPTNEENEKYYNGLKTSDKLNLLTKYKNLPIKYHKEIWDKKQSITINELLKINKNVIHCNMLNDLKNLDFKIACCSNSIKRSVLIILSNLGILPYFDLILSNEDVTNAKPHPEIYWKAMSHFNVLPEQTLILEDSPNGLVSAQKSGSNIFVVNDVSDVTFNNIIEKIKHINDKNYSS